jgi:hypothetical protein
MNTLTPTGVLIRTRDWRAGARERGAPQSLSFRRSRKCAQILYYSYSFLYQRSDNYHHLLFAVLKGDSVADADSFRGNVQNKGVPA